MISDKKLALMILALSMPVFHFTAQAQEGSKELYELPLADLAKIQVVTASKRMQALTEAPATIYVVTEDDIKQYGYRDLKDVLAQLPGIEFSDAHSNLQGGQRGFAENWAQTKLLIDGRTVNKLWSGESYIASQYTLNNVKQIEIIQGPASALYGADAYTGVINIITKNSGNTTEGSDISFALGSHDEVFDSRQISFNAITKEKNLGITLSGTIFNQDGPDFTDFVRSAQFSEVNRPLRNEMLDNGNPYRDNNRAYNANADLSYSISDNSNIAAGIYLLRDEDGGGIENPEISFTNFNYISEQVLTYLRYDREFDSYPVKLTVDVIREDENDYIRFQNREDEGDNPPLLAAFNIEDSRSHTINVQFDISPPSMPNYLIAGFGYYEVNIGEPAFTGLSADDPIVGRYLYPPKGAFANLKPYLDQNKKYIYLQDQHTFFDKLQITLGGRYDHHNIYGGITTIRSGLYYQLTQAWAVKALYGEAFREPTMFEFSEDNPDLVPAEMDTWELSLHFNPIKNIAGQLVYYENHASNLIEAVQRGEEDISVNRGTKKVTGLEGLIKWQFNKLRGNIWYNYERDPDDPDFLEVAKNKFGFGLIYNITNNLSLSFQGKYLDKIKSDALNSDLEVVTITIPEYKSFDLTLLARQISFSTFPDLDLSFSIYNVFDRQNLYPDARGASPSSFLAEGRSFYVRGGIHF
jgi:outer membrane receptor for ferrienterochelin and colicins